MDTNKELNFGPPVNYHGKYFRFSPNTSRLTMSFQNMDQGAFDTMSISMKTQGRASIYLPGLSTPIIIEKDPEGKVFGLVHVAGENLYRDIQK